MHGGPDGTSTVKAATCPATNTCSGTTYGKTRTSPLTTPRRQLAHRRDKTRTRTWTDDEEHIQIELGDETVEMGVYENEARTRPPVAQETRFDAVFDELVFEKDILVEENHGWTNMSKRSESQRQHTPAAM